MSDECMITTLDNPFDYFEQFTSWFMFDVEKGYYTCNYLARCVQLSDDMSQQERDEEIERAIDDIILNNPLPIYKKVRRNSGTQSNQNP